MRLLWLLICLYQYVCHARFVFDKLVDDKVEQMLRDWHVAGATMAIIEGDSITTKAYGWARVAQRVPMETSFLFQIGSLTKSLTAALTSIVLDRDPELNWTTPIRSLLPNDFETSNAESTKHIDLESLLSHSSGIPSHHSIYIDSNGPYGPLDLVHRIRTWEVIQPFLNRSEHPTSRPPFAYCNAGFVTVSCALEARTNRSFSDLMHAELFQPLGMISAGTSLAEVGCHPERECARIARGYEYDRGMQFPQRWRTEPAMSGGGSVISTVGDFALFIRLLLDSRGSSPLSTAGRANLTSPRVTVMEPAWSPWNSATGVKYALGWAVTRLNGVEIFNHIGNMCGFSTIAAFIPESEYDGRPGLGIVVFTNSQEAREGLRHLVSWLLQRMLDVPADRMRGYHGPEYDQCCI